MRTIILLILTAGIAYPCDNTDWLTRWARKHHSDIAGAARYLDSHPAIAKRLDEKCMNAKRKHKKHRRTPVVPTPTATIPIPSPTPTSTVPIVSPTPVPSQTPTPLPSPTPTVSPSPSPTSTPHGSPTPTPTVSPTCTPGEQCVRSRDEWTAEQTWPTTELNLGNHVYEEDDLRLIIEYSEPTDALSNLARELIAAKLNVANGAAFDCIDQQIIDADAAIGDLVPKPVGDDTLPASPPIVQLILDLSNYNKGNFCCASHCNQ